MNLKFRKYNSIERYGKSDTTNADIVNDIIEEELDVLLSTLKKKISKKTPLIVKSVIDEKNSTIDLEVV